MAEVAPDQADHREAGDLAQLILTPLLCEDDVAGLLPRSEQAAVLDPPVELAEQSELRPSPVGDTRDRAIGAPYLVLKFRLREAEGTEQMLST
jgi:hypothetical protein